MDNTIRVNPTLHYLNNPNMDLIDEEDIEDVDYLHEIAIRTPRTPTLRTPPKMDNTRINSPSTSDNCCYKTIRVGSIKFPLSVFICISIVLSLLAGGAIFVHEKFENESECIFSYSVIKIGYLKWLYIYGYTNAGLIGVIFWLFVVSRISSIKIEWLRMTILKLGYLFQLVWYFIGSVLYFYEVNRECSSGNIFYIFGMVLFISQTIVWITIFCQDTM